MLRIQTICLVILTLIAGGFALYYLQSVLLPFVIAFFIVSGCRPILDYLENRFRLHWILSFAVTFGLFLLGFSLLALATITELADDFPKYSKQVEKISKTMGEVAGHRGTQTSQWIQQIGARVGEGKPDADNDLSVPDDSDQPEEGKEPLNDEPVDSSQKSDLDENKSESEADRADSPNADSQDADSQEGDLADQNESVEELLRRFVEQQQRNRPIQLSPIPPTDPNIFSDPRQAAEQLFQSVGEYAQSFVLSVVGTFTGLLSSAVLILIFVFFLLLGRAEATKDPAPIVKAIDDQIRKYIVMKTVISAFTGLATWFVLWCFGVPLAVVFGFLTFLINFIPNIGPVIISLLPVPFLFLSDMNPWTGVLVFVLVSAIQFISGNVVETRLMGKSFDVNPVVLLLGLMFFGLIWGIPGMFLATPIVSVIKIVLQERETTRPFADMLAGRWDGQGFGNHTNA